MNRTYWLLLGLAPLAAAQQTACSAEFHSCQERYTCPTGGAGGAKADSSDGAGEAGEGGKPPDGAAGTGQTHETGGSADTAEGGSAGTANGSDGGEGGVDTNTQTCSASAPCPATAPLCVAGTCQEPPSCIGLAADCGTANESCCTSPLVPGGAFNRDNDPNFPATVSTFRLDKYEVTVGRFRKFVNAVIAGWQPRAGAGKHTHLNNGAGARNSAAAGYEAGWDTAWSEDALPTNKATWDAALSDGGKYQTWTASRGANENRPINDVTWYQATAFCIWDGGFLPSEAEWSYAAVGGSAQRAYPWGSTTPGMNANLAVYGCYLIGHGTCSGVPDIAPVGSGPMGNGLFGQADLVGNVQEHNLDEMSSYSPTCDDCAYLPSPSINLRSRRGGGYDSPLSDTLASWRDAFPPDWLIPQLGVRCARVP